MSSINHNHTNKACGCTGHAHECNENEGQREHLDGVSCECCAEGCEHGAIHEKSELLMICSGTVIFILSQLPIFVDIRLVLYLAAILIPGWELFVKGVKSALKLQLDELFLLTVAVVAAVVLGEYSEAAFVTILFRLGEFLEDGAIQRSHRDIAALTQIRAETANLMSLDGTVKTVDAHYIPVESIIQIRPGERVPLDCVVIDGNSTVDCSAITGESIPVEAGHDDKLPAAAINGAGLLTCRTTSDFSNSAASRIIALVEESAAKKGDTENFITRFSKIYTPVILILAVVLAVLPPLLGMGSYKVWIGRCLIFLVASCPCALVISVPLAFFAGIGAGSKKGVIIKGSKYIERLAKLKCAVFDKTGTLTNGKLKIIGVKAVNSYSEEDVLHIASAAEKNSNHPIARAVCAYHNTLPPHEAHIIGDFVEESGNGVSMQLDGKKIICGSKRYLTKSGIDISDIDNLSVYVAVDGKIAGGIEIADELRIDSIQTLSRLKSQGINQTVMLTGDNENSAQCISRAANVDRFFAGLLPQDKVTRLEECKREFGCTVFVGDGINDAPVLACADVGVAMGLGSDAAIEAADVVLVSDRLGSLADAVEISRHTMRIAKFNIIFALTVKIIVLILGAMGIAQMWMAVFADVGVSILAVLNAMRILAVKREVISS